jgi:CHAT domain-containing protein
MLRGFLTAGALQVLASLWPVGDEQTTTFMTRLYDDRYADRSGGARGSPIPKAQGVNHRETARSLRHTTAETRREVRNPYVWAPFVLYTRRPDAAAKGDRGER